MGQKIIKKRVSVYAEDFLIGLVEEAEGKFEIDASVERVYLKREGAGRTDNFVHAWLNEGDDIYLDCVNGETLDRKSVWLGQAGAENGFIIDRAIGIADIFLNGV